VCCRRPKAGKLKARRGKAFILFLVLICFPASGSAAGGVVKGIYGVPSIGARDPLSYVGDMEKAGVNAVFVPADQNTVRYFKDRGFKVYVSVNVFGGKGAWKRYPDARPVMADGSLLGSEEGYKAHGGVCPTHEGWRQGRLSRIEELVTGLGGEGGIDGIWLDFIRYPGRWETPAPEIPDTCYCARCLARFQQDTGILVPGDLGTKEASQWIRSHCAHDWMQWKKAQIASFVRDVRGILDRCSEMNRPILGLFLVPWTKGERGNDVSYLLAQDPFQLSELADVISPMVYHEMCGRGARWVGYMTQYYRETAKARVWPIVEAVEAESIEAQGSKLKAQSGTRKAESSKLKAQREKGYPLSVIGYQGEEKRTGELEKVARFAAEGGADGVLVYSFKAVDQTGLWDGFRGFESLPDMLWKEQGAGSREQGAELEAQSSKLEAQSSKLKAERQSEGEQSLRITNQRITNNDSVSVTALDEWGEEWVTAAGACEAGKAYVFTGELWRDGWQNGVYPAVRLWGKEFLLDTHLKAKYWQPVRVNVVCPDEVTDPCFRFINRHRGETFRLRRPEVGRLYRFDATSLVPVKKGFFDDGFFPIGVYGADLENLEGIKRLAINTVILGGSGEKLRERVEKCHQIGLRYVLSVPRDPDRLPVYLDEISRYVRPYDTAFYVNDEPGIWSFPVNRAEDIHRLIKDRFPGCATCMAVVRPHVCGDYAQAADFFMLDQYPVPFMPMTWLSDCMGECGRGIAQGAGRMETQSSKLEGQREAQRAKGMAQSGADESSSHPIIQSSNTQYPIPNTPAKRLAAVVQAFGGDRWRDVGWPRMPTEEEMRCLAFLSVVHGARAIFFYTYPEIGRTDEGREALGRVVGRLNQVYPWLVEENSDAAVEVEMVSENRLDPRGRPAVQCCVKQKGDEALLIAVNTIGTCVEALIGAERRAQSAERETQSAESKVHSAKEGKLRDEGINRMNGRLDGKVTELFSGEEYAIKDGKLRVRLGPYEVKVFRMAHGA